MVTRNIDPNADEEVRIAHVMRGYRASNYTQIETLVFMALFERAHAVYLHNVEAKTEEPVLKKLVGRIVNDEDRHAKFFDNLVAHCIEQHRDSTIAAIARRATGFPVIGGDILEYRESKLWSPTPSSPGVWATSRSWRNSSARNVLDTARLRGA